MKYSTVYDVCHYPFHVRVSGEADAASTGFGLGGDGYEGALVRRYIE